VAPLHALELKEKVHDVDWMREVDEGVPDVALSLNNLKVKNGVSEEII
jgi:hypothetical protein